MWALTLGEGTSIKTVVVAVSVTVLCVTVLAEAGSGIIRRLEAFRAPTGVEFLFVWGDGVAFCISEPVGVTFQVQPDRKPQEFYFDASGVTLKLHRAEIAAPWQELDISDFCD